MSVCHGCGGPLAPSKAPGRPRKWCSERCRKAQYDQQCVHCGGRASGTDPGDVSPDGARCVDCAKKHRTDAQVAHLAAAKARRRARWERIRDLALTGKSHKEIAREVGSTANRIHVELYAMRAAGWDVPHRYSDERIARMREGRWGRAA